MYRHFTKLSLAGLSLLLGFAIAAGNQALAQSWTELSPSGGPPPVRDLSSAVHNPTSNRMIVFAGLKDPYLVGVDALLNDVWVLENADGMGGTLPNWIQLSPTGGPPAARVAHSAVYDPGTNRMTVFAGDFLWGYCEGTPYADAWVLSNADGLGGTPTWTQLFPTGGPPSGRFVHSAVYDPEANRMIVFGGAPACGVPDNQVWVLTNANGLGETPEWILLSPTGGPVPGSVNYIAGYDLASNRMTVFGGSLGSDVWVLENANGLGTPNWIQLSPTGGPPTTLYGRGVYNPATNQLIAFGGTFAGTGYSSNEVWILDNANGLGGAPNWTQPSPIGGLPSERSGNTAVMNVGTNRMTVFGGFNNRMGPTYYNDVWVFSPAVDIPPTAVAGPDQMIRVLGDTIILDGSASFDDNTASAALGYAWSFTPLGLPLGSMATLLDADTVTPSFVADVPGTYVVELVVTDEDALSSAADQVEISSDNLAPTAAAGDDQLVVTGTNVMLDGSGSSDPENDELFYYWTITAAPVGSIATLTFDATVSPELTPDLEGVYEVMLTVSDFLGAGAPDSVEITATTAEGFAETQIVSVDIIVAALAPGQVTTAGNQNALQNFLSQAIVALQAGDVEEAINKLEKAIARTDGCVLRGAPDGNGPGRDWITDCASQTAVYNQLNDALDALLAP